MNVTRSSAQHRVLFGILVAIFCLIVGLPSTSAHAQTAQLAGQVASQVLQTLLSKNGQSAVTNAGLTGNTAADKMCTPVIQDCGCGSVRNDRGYCVGGSNKYKCACAQVENGITVAGICTATLHCEAKTVGGMNGGAGSSPTDLSKLGQTVAQLLQSLMQGGGGGGGGGGTGGSGTQGCTAYYPVSSPSSDPCAYYVPDTVPATSSVDTTSQDLLNALNGGTNGSSTDQFKTGGNGTNNTSGTGLNHDLSSGPTITGTYNPLNPPQATPNANGLSGNIVRTDTGATFTSSNVQGNSGSSSFFGSDTFNGAVGGLVSGWCRARPWASGFFASIIAPTFFDGLCKQGGFAVGNPTPASVPVDSISLTQTAIQNIKPPTPPVITTSTPSVPGRVDIWAVPTSVSLGSRTTIFWNTSNVTNCTETSPDGSFNQTTLSGGAATVPLTEATIYTISCLDLGKNPVTGYVTVTIGG